MYLEEYKCTTNFCPYCHAARTGSGNYVSYLDNDDAELFVYDCGTTLVVNKEGSTTFNRDDECRKRVDYGEFLALKMRK